MRTSVLSPSTILSRLLILLSALLATDVQGQALSGKDLLFALRQGGYVFVMRHASSPRTPPDPREANSDNVTHERQLDDAGRASARAMGEALRQLRIPVGQVLSSPTYRARETIKLAQLGEPKTFPQLGDSGQSMQADPSGARAAWLRAKAAAVPVRGMNTVIVTHLPNVMEAFANSAVALADGEALVFHPDGHGGTQIVARVKIDAWPRLVDSSR
jgi:phosphohistidine phosphatase SixA